MGNSVRFGNIRLEAEFHQAVREDGSHVSFTKTERLILIELTRHPHIVYSRNQLLDVVSGFGSDANDRNIDFSINRIRNKLGDSAKNPKYIATYYGEGYAWVCDAHEQVPVSAGAYVVVGPVHGIGYVEEYESVAQGFVFEFQKCMSGKMNENQKVVLDPNCPSPEEFTEGWPKFSIDLYFITIADCLNCVVTLRNFRSGNVLFVSRQKLVSAPIKIDPELVENIASQFASAIWRSYVTETSIKALPESSPLHISIYEAARKVACEAGNWKDNDPHLRQAVLDDENDGVAKLMLATNIHLKYIQDGLETMLGPDTRSQDDDEVEELVLESLPHIQSNDVLVLAAAKLLFFLGRGYRTLAVEMAENAFKNSTAIASSLTIVGQMRMYLGEFGQAIDLLEQAQELSKEGTQFHYYLLFIKCQTYLAGGNWKKLRIALDDFFEKIPEARFTVSIFFASAGNDEIQPEAKVMAENISQAQAQAILVLANYVYARLFAEIEPKINIFRGLLPLMVEHFGPDVVPEEIRYLMPILGITK